MPAPTVAEYTLNTGPGTQTINVEIGPVDLSWHDALTLTINCTKASSASGSSDTCAVYLQERDEAGNWHDRIAATPLTGALSPSSSAPEVLRYVLQQFGALDATEEGHEPSGSSGGSRLTAGTVRNGPFAGKYRPNGVWTANWRFQIVVTDADANADFEGTLYLRGSYML